LELYKEASNIRLLVSRATSDLRMSTNLRNLEKSILMTPKDEPKVQPRPEPEERKVQPVLEERKVDAVAMAAADRARLEETVRRIIAENPDALRSILQAENFIVRKPNASVHREYRCNLCNVLPIQGTRYACTVCADFDICEACEAADLHDGSHPLVMFRIAPASTPKQQNLVIPMPEPVFKPNEKLRLFAKLMDDSSFPDRAVLDAGTVAIKTWRVMNSGPTAWPEGCTLQVLSGDRSIFEEKDLAQTLARVEAGATQAIELPVQVPAKLGQFIVYFRLVDPQGAKFGPRLWVDFRVDRIAVMEPEEPGEPIIEPIPEPARKPGKFADELDQLTGMGFNNDPNLNIFLLQKFNGNVQRVVDWHLSRMQQ